MENKVELEGIFENGYGFVSKKIMQDKELSLQAKGIYSYLCSFSGKGKDVFPSRNRICYDLGISNDTLGKYTKELKEKAYIEIKQEKSNGKFANNIYKICLNLPCTKTPCPKISDTEELDTNNNIYYNNNNINNNNNKKKKLHKESSNVCKKAIARLNELTNSKFGLTAQSSIESISSLLNAGYTENDILEVIDKMCYKWGNPKKGERDLSEFLRPSTLFRKSNFENYLGMNVKKKQWTTNDISFEDIKNMEDF